MSERLMTLLQDAGIRPTKQRVALAKVLFKGNTTVHISAEKLYSEVLKSKAYISFATVYNTLRQFCDSGLLKEVTIDSKRAYFDTNTSDHHHLLHEKSGRLEDVSLPSRAVAEIVGAFKLQAHHKVKHLNILIRIDGN